MTDIQLLGAIERKILWLSTWMIHNANSKAEGVREKVGGHQASSASLVTVLTVLYLTCLRPKDKITIKPHAAPVLHAIQYFLGRKDRDSLEKFRSFGGSQAYPSRTKDGSIVDFSTGSVGMGAAQILFASLVNDYLNERRNSSITPSPKMVAVIGDAEMDEGIVYEALLEGWKQGLKNCWWIIDYNRQSLDTIVQDGLVEKLQDTFAAFGWDVCVLKYGKWLERAFEEPGGSLLKTWLDNCPNETYSRLVTGGGADWRRQLLEDLSHDGTFCDFIGRRSDAALAKLMTNLAGHDIPTLLQTFSRASQDRPVAFIIYTIKGYGLPMAGHRTNHSAHMSQAQLDEFRESNNVRNGHEWDIAEGLPLSAVDLANFLACVPYSESVSREHAAAVSIPLSLPGPRGIGSLSTQQAFSLMLHSIARSNEPFAEHIVTASPDVSSSTGLAPWIRRRKVFARSLNASDPDWERNPLGQHFQLGVAEMNLFMLLSAAGLSHDTFGKRLLPIGTVYDPFIIRGLDALNYACYQDARFILAATPSGISLSTEGGAHQSIATPLIGISQSGLTAFEPAFADELNILMRFSLDFIQREDERLLETTTFLPDRAGGAVYLRLSTRQIEQPDRCLAGDLAAHVISGGYWLREVLGGTDIVLVYTGAVVPEVLEAASELQQQGLCVGVLAITSTQRLFSGWLAAQSARRNGASGARSHIERLLDTVPLECSIITVLDGHPSALSWLGSVRGHQTYPLGVTEFGQSGSRNDLYKHHGIDSDTIIRAGIHLGSRSAL